jgi:hypothetical protein
MALAAAPAAAPVAADSFITALAVVPAAADSFATAEVVPAAAGYFTMAAAVPAADRSVLTNQSPRRDDGDEFHVASHLKLSTG